MIIPHTRISGSLLLLVLGGLSAIAACGDDGDPPPPYDTEADWLGVGAACASNEQCYQGEDGGFAQTCLSQFKGGYCGVENCQSDNDCPQASACVVHDDGKNYCFRSCVDKTECNRNRPVDVEANCSSNITFTDSGNKGKACVPPSG